MKKLIEHCGIYRSLNEHGEKGSVKYLVTDETEDSVF